MLQRLSGYRARLSTVHYLHYTRGSICHHRAILKIENLSAMATSSDHASVSARFSAPNLASTSLSASLLTDEHAHSPASPRSTLIASASASVQLSDLGPATISHRNSLGCQHQRLRVLLLPSLQRSCRLQLQQTSAPLDLHRFFITRGPSFDKGH